jgi:hypothetical protein
MYLKGELQSNTKFSMERQNKYLVSIFMIYKIS